MSWWSRVTACEGYKNWKAVAVVVLCGLSGLASAEPPSVETTWRHETMETAIGKPAIIAPDGAPPTLEITLQHEGAVQAQLWREGEAVEAWSAELAAGETEEIALPGDNLALGAYEARLDVTFGDGATAHDRLHFTVLDESSVPEKQSRIVHEGPEGRLRYVPDYRGNRILDFSYAGYRGGGVSIPDAPVRAEIEPGDGDDTERIQHAIDEVSARSPDENGFRGAVLLRAGVYEVADSLRIEQSGVVLRGEGPGSSRAGVMPEPPGALGELKEALADEQATILLATGEERRIVLRIAGEEGRAMADKGVEITDAYVPVGARHFHVHDPDALSVGDSVVVQRHGNADWIQEIGMHDIPPRPNGSESPPWEPFDLELDRVIEGIDGDRVRINAPLTTAIEQRWGGGEVIPYECRRIEEVGVEGMRVISVWRPNEDGVDDTRHADRFCHFDNVVNGWARDLIVEHFYGTNGAISTGYKAKRLTFKDNEILVADNDYYSGPGYSARVFEETGVYTGRYGYRLQGQFTLARDSYTIHSRHAFTVGRHAAGMNVFLDCLGERPVSTSQPHFRWSVGGLYDNVEDEIAIQNRMWYGTSHGWAGANYVAWNTRGSLIAQQPPTAQNWAIGHVGDKRSGAHADIIADLRQGHWESHGEHVQPRSLYFRQLEERLDNAGAE